MRHIDKTDTVAIFLAAVLIAATAPASTTILPSHHFLACGSVRYELTNLYAPDATIGRQTMKGRRPNGSEFSIDVRNRNQKLHQGITASVAEWLCIRARHHTFIELLYSCNIDMTISDTDRYCRGNAMEEWLRYIGLDGQPLDPGFHPDDPRYDALRRRLGIFGNRRIQVQEQRMIPVD